MKFQSVNTKSFRVLLAIGLIIMTFMLTACGSSSVGNSAENDSETINALGAPIANAGPDQSVTTGNVVILDGSGSTGNGTLTYSWTIDSKPTGSTAALSDSTIVNPTFTADLDGDYVISLVVSFHGSSSAPDSVTITASGPGTLDAIYGTNGMVTFDGGYNEIGYSVAIQSDGKALSVVESHNGTDNDIMLLRYNTDGSLDTSYGTNGIATYDSGSADIGYSIAIQSDGKALVTGRTGIPTHLVLLRFNTDGSLDTNFGTNGVSIYDSGNSEIGHSVAIQSDGKILVAGEGSALTNFTNDLILVRFNTNGSLDTSFGTSGVAIYDNSAHEYGYSVAIQSDGKALVAGHSYIGSVSDILLLRFSTSGSLDTSFGTNGVVTYDGGYDDIGRSVAIQSDGKPLVAGISRNGSGSDYHFVLLRYTSSGSLDTSFGTNGVVTYDSGYSDNAWSVAIQSDDKSLVAGSGRGTWNVYNPDLVLIRYNTDGSLDTSFGTSGVAHFDGGYGDGGQSVVIQADGKPLVAGGSYCSGCGGNNFLLVRFNK